LGGLKIADGSSAGGIVVKGSDADIPGIIGDVNISMGSNQVPHHCFCIAHVTGTGTGIFVSEFGAYYIVTPENSLDSPWTEMNGHPRAFLTFDEWKNIKLSLKIMFVYKFQRFMNFKGGKSGIIRG